MGRPRQPTDRSQCQPVGTAARRFALICLAVLAGAGQAPRTSNPTLAITHVTIIDATGAPPVPDKTVVVAGDRIATIAKSAAVAVPAAAQTVDASGKFLIPGLWDMHAHPFLLPSVPADVFLDGYLARGVTSLRDPSGPLDAQLRGRAAQTTSARPGPRLSISGPVLDGPVPLWPGVAIPVGTDLQARRAVRSLAQAGVDFVKVYDFLPRLAYFAIADEARRLRLPFAGHVPIALTAADASDAGQASIEHVIHLFESCSSEEPTLQKEALALVARATASGRVADVPGLIRELFHIELRAERSYDEARAAALFARFVRNGTVSDPTLVAHSYERGLEPRADPRLKYVPAVLRESWRPEHYLLSRAFTAEDRADAKRIFHRRLDLVGSMFRAGVTIVAGTDSPTTAYSIPGFALHDELEFLVKAGLTPMAALQAATRNAAQLAGRLDRLGTIETGKLADLVLLDANPLDDIHNTTTITAVVVNGALRSKSDLEALLARMEAAVKDR